MPEGFINIWNDFREGHEDFLGSVFLTSEPLEAIKMRLHRFTKQTPKNLCEYVCFLEKRARGPLQTQLLVRAKPL